ncbi:acetyl esterase [Micromonospora pisi]|uniref:Acetyl esterase n=1 Tax=Micromonospora pisi TaxID=589240 RepID=A0A495JUJ5_9ACTN|nr:alpha/beta hydrolase [Micromonospora pisi]RKR92208.1 acetyl esterase [Micromonospora pisi]
MNDKTGRRQPPLGIRVLHALRKEPDWLTMPTEALDAFREAENRRRASPLARVITGFPDRRATIGWQQLALPDRVVRVRVYRSSPGPGGPDAGPVGLPLVLHVHGGGFVGTAAQSDWVNSHLAGRLPAVVVSVEHRLLAPGTPLSAAVDDGWDVLRHVVEHAKQWGIDPARIAVLGESTGAMVAALAAVRARDSDLVLRAQVLVNPCVDLTSTAFDHTSVSEHANSPTLTVTQLELLRRLAVPEGTDPRAVSPLYADNLSGLAPALVVVPTLDPLADHGRTYAERLREAGTPTRLTEHPGATHAFLSMPGVVPQAKVARAQIAEFLRDHLAE